MQKILGIYFSTNRLAILILFLVLLIACLASCNSDGKKEESKNLKKETKYFTDELSVQHGMQLFNQNCASCHNFNENEIGPSLGGITSAVDKSWLKTFINDPKAVIEGGDERSGELYEKYKLYMPSFSTIKDRDLEDLLGFIHKFSEGEKKSRNKRSGGLLDPVSDKIPESDLILVIEEFLTVPSSSKSAPVARINKLSAIKTEQGERLFIADLRGKLYEIIDTTAHVYLDANIEIEKFIDNPGLGTGLGSFSILAVSSLGVNTNNTSPNIFVCIA